MIQHHKIRHNQVNQLINGHTTHYTDQRIQLEPLLYATQLDQTNDNSICYLTVGHVLKGRRPSLNCATLGINCSRFDY